MCLDQLQSMFSSNAQAIVDLWRVKVLQGVSACMHYEFLADDLSNKTVGYSFLTDHHNSYFKEDQDILEKPFFPIQQLLPHLGVTQVENGFGISVH